MTLNRIKLEPQLLLWDTLQSWLKGLWFIIHSKAFNFHDWIFCYHEPFHNNRKNQRKQTIDLHFKKNFKAPFYGWGSIASKLEPIWGGSLLFTTKLPEIPGIYSFYQPQKDERLSQPWSHPVVLNTGPLDWESSALTTRPLFHNH